MEKIKRIDDITLIPEMIGEAGIENEVTISPEAMTGIFKDMDVTVSKPFDVHYVVEREKDSDTICATVDVRGEIEASCSRCLEPIRHTVDLHLKTAYLPALPDMSGDLEAERSSSETGYYRNIIRLGDYIVSELGLSLPLRFICSEDCKGLCPGCGANLNREECRCETAPKDPRMKKLMDLKDKLRRK
ncbi:MAG TPA: DUF177 domain-containing protein [Deltaproteobacteria bacterium]|nr:DUF177 domain-containing protein [Deltaproteobacteria bacterium]HQJ09472.1 DUF177 domain-containing protein [Deltaproteobacteria bacterium]